MVYYLCKFFVTRKDEPPVSNHSYHREDLKSELIREGLSILDQEGYEGFSLRKVAKACNVSQTAPYRHFKNKDELIAGIMMEAMRAFNQSLEEAVLQYPDDSVKQLKEIGVAYIRFFSKNPEYLRLLFSNDLFVKMSISSHKKGEQDVCSPDSRLKSGHPFATFYKAVENYAASSSNHSMERDELILYCWGLVHGISVLLSNKEEIPYRGDCLALAEKIIRNEKFLK